MELEIQKYLRAGNSFSKLNNDYAIRAKQSNKFPELYLFKYNQIGSPMRERIVQECRGLILNKEDDWNIVSRPYDKFFNYGEGHAPNLDWASTKVFDKLDGSLMTMYYYKDEWHVSTSGTPDADVPVLDEKGQPQYFDDGVLITFSELFWRVWNEQGNTLPCHKSVCFMFELMTPYNKVVVQHQDSYIVLHGAREVETGEELPLEYWENWPFDNYNWDVVDRYGFGTLEEVIEACKKLNPVENEGYVLVDKNFNRVKVKNPQYVALCHLGDSLTKSLKDTDLSHLMIDIIRTNECSEFLTYFPVYLDHYNKVKALWDTLVVTIESTVTLLKSLHGDNPDKKTIGLATKTLSFQGILFPIIYDGKTVDYMLQNMPLRKLERLLKEVQIND